MCSRDAVDKQRDVVQVKMMCMEGTGASALTSATENPP